MSHGVMSRDGMSCGVMSRGVMSCVRSMPASMSVLAALNVLNALSLVAAAIASMTLDSSAPSLRLGAALIIAALLWGLFEIRPASYEKMTQLHLGFLYSPFGKLIFLLLLSLLSYAGDTWPGGIIAAVTVLMALLNCCALWLLPEYKSLCATRSRPTRHQGAIEDGLSPGPGGYDPPGDLLQRPLLQEHNGDLGGIHSSLYSSPFNSSEHIDPSESEVDQHWEEAVDANTGRTSFHNLLSGVTTFRKPLGFP